MALHRLTSITMGVPNVEETAAYYDEFGLAPDGDGWFTTRNAGRELRIVPAPTRRLIDLHVGVDDSDDLARAAGNLERMGIGVERGPGWISAVDKATGTRAYLEIAARFEQDEVPPTPYNGPGRYERSNDRAPGVQRTDRVMPRKLGHAGLGSTHYEATQAFFINGLGFKVSDHIKGAGTFMRCSTDHHNVLVLGAPVVPASHVVAGGRRRRRGPGRLLDARRSPRAAHLGAGPALRRVELLLVPEGPGRQLQRVLQRYGLHRR